MATTTVQLSETDNEALNKLAETYGDRSSAISAAIQELAEKQARLDSLTQFVSDWNEQEGSVSEARIDEIADRFRLG